MEKLLVEVKRVCDQVSLTNYEHLPTMFADRQEFESFRKSSEQKFLTVNTFTSYQKSQEARLQSIEEKLGNHNSLLTIHFHDKNDSNESKCHFNLNDIIRFFKNGDLQWLWATLASISIAMFAVFLLRSITT